jgi:uncharacterized MnhB-related membrane protein
MDILFLSLAIGLALMIVLVAVAAVVLKDVLSSVIAAGVVSLLASVLYLTYGAPDVAMTEAAIGSALTTVVFLFAWYRVKSIQQEDSSEGKPTGGQS